MLEGMVQELKEDVARGAARGGLFLCAGLLATMASVFLTLAIVFALEPVMGRALAYLGGGIFLLLVCGCMVLIAMAKHEQDARIERERHALYAASSPTGAATATTATSEILTLLTSGLANGALEKQLRDHPLRSLGAALAAGTVMGIMESRQDD